MRKHIYLMILLISSIGINAQTFVNDPKAKEIIDRISKDTKSFTTIFAEFTMKMDNQQEDISEEFEGKVYVKGEKYHLSVMGTETYSDGKTIWTHLTEAEEVNISSRDPEDDSFLSNPQKVFTIKEEEYKMKYIGEVKSEGLIYNKIELYPGKLDQGVTAKNKKISDLSKIVLLTGKENHQIKEAAYYGKNGNIYTVIIKKFVTNKPVADTEFIFDVKKHPEIEVIDLREE